MPSEIEYINYKEFVEGLTETESPASSDKVVVSNPTDGPRVVPADTSALSKDTANFSDRNSLFLSPTEVKLNRVIDYNLMFNTLNNTCCAKYNIEGLDEVFISAKIQMSISYAVLLLKNGSVIKGCLYQTSSSYQTGNYNMRVDLSEVDADEMWVNFFTGTPNNQLGDLAGSFYPCLVSYVPINPLLIGSNKLSQSVREEGKFFFYTNLDYRANNRGFCDEYDVTGKKYVLIHYSYLKTIEDIPAVVVKKSDNSYEYFNPLLSTSAPGIEDYSFIIPLPPTAVKMYVNQFIYSFSKIAGNADVYEVCYQFINSPIKEVIKTKKQVNILFIGNSLTQDAVSYLPLLLKEHIPDIDFNLTMWYIGGATLEDHWTRIQNNQDPDQLSFSRSYSAWVNSVQNMDWVRNNVPADLICMQEYFNYKDSYTASDCVYYNNIVKYLKNVNTGVIGTRNPEFACLIHAPKRGPDFRDIYNLTISGNKVLLENTPATKLFVPGIAIFKGCDTALDGLGDSGHLSPDGTHAQEGLPCMLESYVMLAHILEWLGRPINIVGSKTRVTAANYDSIHVPGPNLGTGVVEGTEEQYLLAQRVACYSFNRAKTILGNLSL